MIVIGLVLLAGTLDGIPAEVTLIESERGSVKGRITYSGVPTGTYTLNIWQELLGDREVQVTVKAGEESELIYSYEAAGQ